MTTSNKSSSTNPYADFNIVSTYTRQDAINDGTFIDVTQTAKSCGLLIPVALTAKLYNTFIKSSHGEDSTANNLNLFLKELCQKILANMNADDRLLYLQFNFDCKGHTDVWVAIEAQSPNDPSPALNVFLPEEY